MFSCTLRADGYNSELTLRHPGGVSPRNAHGSDRLSPASPPSDHESTVVVCAREEDVRDASPCMAFTCSGRIRVAMGTNKMTLILSNCVTFELIYYS